VQEVIITRCGESRIFIVKQVSEDDEGLLAKARFTPDRTGRKTGYPGAWWTTSKVKAARLASVADNTCRAQLETIANQRKASIAASRATAATFSVPAPDGLDYLPFQRAGIKYMSERQHILLGDEMGLGKTVQVLGLMNLQKPKHVLVVCPASLKLNWEHEAHRWLVDERQVIVIDAKTRVETLDFALTQGPTLFIINYDITSKGSNYKVQAGKSISFGPIHEWMRRTVWNLFVCDEAHYLKSPGTRRTLSILGRDRIPAKRGRNAKPEQPAIPPVPADRVVLATGTPIPNRPIEAQPLLGRLSSEFSNYWAFANTYCNATPNEFGIDVGGASNLDELQHRLRSTVMVRRLKRDVLTELPAKVRQVIDLPKDGMAKLLRAEKAFITKHAKMLKHLRREVAKAHASWEKASQTSKVQQETDLKARYSKAVAALEKGVSVAFHEMSIVRRDTAIAKIPKVIDYLKGMFAGGVDKVVVMAHHRRVIEEIAAAFDNSVVLYGGMNDQAKHGAVTRFQNDPSCPLFVGSIQAAGVGLTLTAASNVVFAELDWVPANLMQAEDRCHRMGQRDSVLVQHLVVDGSLDSTIAHRVVSKQAVIEQGLDSDIESDLVSDVFALDN
jgi:SWI/SNF-related matrix-associated actin-dependent regulator 1 of chromatin subfamily A